ncbi:MAG: hypothetical protein M3T55_06550 [Pseudomonadota bacterium]|nr:hypothetical protein [Pseudomonadota bacterium]
MIAVTGAVTATTANLIVAAGGASLSGGGSFVLSNTATNRIYGATAAATLTNVNDRIAGAGLLGNGQMTLVNDAGGLIEGDGTLSLTLDTGANTIANNGLIEAMGAGGVAVKSAVSGTGTTKIGAGTLSFASAFNQAVTFTGTTGVLELARSQAYTAAIRGFSKTGGTSLDLTDIAFGGSTKASYSGTATSGTLTVTDGTHTAGIRLIGDYTASTFTVASDGHGGTTAKDPAKTAGPPGPLPPWVSPGGGHRFIDAMAGLGSRASATMIAGQCWQAAAPMLLAPRIQTA